MFLTIFDRVIGGVKNVTDEQEQQQQEYGFLGVRINGKVSADKIFLLDGFFFNDGDELKDGKFDGLKDEREV